MSEDHTKGQLLKFNYDKVIPVPMEKIRELELRCHSQPANFFKLKDITRHRCKDPTCCILEQRLSKILKNFGERRKDNWISLGVFGPDKDAKLMEELQALLTEQ